MEFENKIPAVILFALWCKLFLPVGIATVTTVVVDQEYVPQLEVLLAVFHTAVVVVVAAAVGVVIVSEELLLTRQLIVRPGVLSLNVFSNHSFYRTCGGILLLYMVFGHLSELYKRNFNHERNV